MPWDAFGKSVAKAQGDARDAHPVP
jgi:hypothetical protein